MAEAREARTNVGTDATLVPSPDVAKTAISVGSTVRPTASGATTQGRSTVLPSFDAGKLVHRERDRYETVEVLGRGGMGEVVLGRDHDIGREVALKYLHPEGAAAGVARFVEEIRTVGSLEHPNIVPIHDVGLDEQGRYFFVMKRLEGETLEVIIEKLRARDPAYESKYTFERRADIAIGILNALEFAHARGIVHRDVKPANVMIGRHGEVVLMDWGIAKMVGTEEIAGSALAGIPPTRVVETQAGSLLGTPLYMSPEQADGRLKELDARSDLYSVAVTVHELMTLRHYLHGRSELAEVLTGVKTVVASNRPADYYDSGFPSVPAGYLHICTKGTQKDPAQRFQSASEMSERIRRVRDGCVDVQCGLTFTRRSVGEVGRWVDRHPRLTVFAVPTAFLVVAASLAISVVSVAHWVAGAG